MPAPHLMQALAAFSSLPVPPGLAHQGLDNAGYVHERSHHAGGKERAMSIPGGFWR
jgi:hypothetical protein